MATKKKTTKKKSAKKKVADQPKPEAQEEKIDSPKGLNDNLSNDATNDGCNDDLKNDGTHN